MSACGHIFTRHGKKNTNQDRRTGERGRHSLARNGRRHLPAITVRRSKKARSPGPDFYLSITFTPWEETAIIPERSGPEKASFGFEKPCARWLRRNRALKIGPGDGCVFLVSCTVFAANWRRFFARGTRPRRYNQMVLKEREESECQRPLTNHKHAPPRVDDNCCWLRAKPPTELNRCCPFATCNSCFCAKPAPGHAVGEAARGGNGAKFYTQKPQTYAQYRVSESIPGWGFW